jgi:hypothetical protein
MRHPRRSEGDTLAEVRRIVGEIRDRWASGQSGGERMGTCDEILKRLEGK